MVPAAFVRLEKLPLTVNGKLDRKALPEPDADAYPTHGYDPPVGETETMVAAIWAESLQVQRVGRHDNFFALGGHSLLAVRLIERMRRAGLPTTVRALFATSTLAEFAAEIGSPTEPVEAPPNRIPVGSAVITPAMLPLVDLTEAEIARIVRGVPGGAANVRDIYPLAPLQAGILFHHVMGGEGDPYLLATDVSFESRPLLDAYLEALQQVIARHDILRTAVMWEGLSEPVQVVCGDAALPVEVVELDAGAGDVADQLHARFDPRRYRIDVSRAPMMRAYIARDTAREQWRLLLLSHHLVTDHSSLEVIAREIDAHLLGQADRLPPPLPFRNLVAQARFGVRQDEHIAYFQRLLGDVTEPTAPFGLLDVQGDGTRLADARVRLDEALARRLRTCARALRVSVASLCHLAWAQVLGCVSGREDVVFGTVLFGRMQGGVGADRVMGLFINTLPVRIHVGGQGVAESVRRTHAQLTDLLRHEHAPLALAQRCSAVPAPAPLFSAILNYRHGTAASPEQEDARPRVGMRDRSGQERTNYPVTLNVDDLGEALGLVAQAEASIGPRRVCALMTTALTSLVDALETAPARAVRTLRVLPPDEWEQVVVRWNATAAPYAADRCVHELFEAQAARTPDAVAVMCGSEAVSYDTLNARANQLAWCLRAHGVGPEVRVGLCLERGPALIVALLGVWKAGGAYVPIDPAYPAERVAYMFTDAGVRVLLTLETLRETLPVMPGVEVLALDAQAAEIAAWPTHAVRTEATAQNLAYVIYTSGSTGRPKGVAMHHYGVCNYIEWGSQAYGAGEGNGSPVFTSMAVDLTITNLLPLFVGRPVHLLREDNAVEALADALSGRSGFGPIKITPTHLSLVTPLLTLETAQAAAHTLVIGADFLAAETTLFWQDHAPGVRLMNEYGPTETVVGCSAYTLPRGVHRHGPVPVGGPIQNLRFYVLDTRGEPAPIGVAGELYIGGVGVARGYLGRPGLSAEKFVPDPFAEPGARMYRTGDRARWLEDGNLLILGRTDHQVKVRGYRVELGEIEAALRRHEAVSECLVAVREDQPGDKRLVAYVVSAATASDLRAHLRRALPEYMVPSAFVTLDALPDTTTGKFDRRSLPAPDYSTDGRQDVAPRTAVEELLCGIWQRVLRVEQVGIDDNFFDRGGHSLLAMQVIAQVREVFGVDVPLRRVFDFPTIAGFAEPFDTARQSGACVAASPLPRITQRDGLPASHEQQQLWVIDQLEPGGAAYNIPVGLRLRGALEADALERALREVTDRHAVLRTRFRTQDGRPVQTIEPAWRGQLTRVDLQHLDATAREAEVRRLATEDALRPFDLSRGPLLRTQLLRLGDREHVLLATMHHIVTDAWSMGILIRELGTLYAAFLRGEPSPLPEPDVQYADYSEWQREWSRGAAAEHELRYWERRLAGVPALELPTDRRRPAIQTFRGGRCVATVPRAVRQQLRAVGRRESVTPFMLLLAAFKALLHRYTGVTDLAIGTQVAGRNRPELGSVVGMFLNTLVLRTDLSGTPTVREVLQRVRQVTLEAYANQNVPFERVLEAVRPPRDVSFNPLFQVMLIYQRGSASDVSFPGLTVEPIESVNKTSKLDLTAYVHDGDELSIAFEYNTDLFDETTIVRYLGHWMRVLEEMARDAEQPVGALEILSREERQQVVEDWNRTTVSAAPERCVHELFEAQAARTPAAVAVIDDQGERTYEQMEARAAAIAEVLRARDLGPGDVVAVCMERSAAAVAALLGVMKCGAAYVPLEPSLPFERMATILSTVTAPCVITGRSQLARLAALRDAVPSLTAAVCIDDDDDGAGGAGTLVEWRGAAPARGGARRALPDDLAYVIFTSGSTGVPKGVAVTHRAVGNVIDWVNRTWAIGPTDRVLCVSSFGFDLSVYDLFGPLAAGGSVRIVATAATRDPEALWRLLRREPITVWDSTPAALQQLTPWFTAGAGADAALRLVLLSGDWIPVALPDQVRQAYPRVEVVALGGATEATIWSNVYRVGAVDPGWPSIPYGTPIPRARYYVLTPTLTPCPIGVRGGLYIGGAVLAQGYLGNARQTAAQFVPDPFAAAPGARLYQTGDCARWRADGQLEFLGRVDDQVKIRGYRVELGEIEAVLRERCGIRETVVVVREDAPGQQRLVAYVLGQDAPSGSDLRTRLREWLPDYMIPAAVVPMEIFPLTPNGKVDRKALPAPSGERAAASAYVPPRTPVEQLLSAIWQRVLRVDRVGVEDNFFELGGDSILGIQIASAVREAGLRINVQQIFRDQTIASIAEHVPESTSSVDDVAEGAVPLTPIQAWFFALELPEPWHFNQSVLLRVPEHVSADAVSAALDVLVRHHDALRLRFTRHEDGRWTQAYARAAARPAVLDRIDLRDHGAAARLASFEREAQRMHAGLDLEAGPLFRAGWFDLEAGEQRLLLVAHHLVIDGVSWRIVVEDLQRLCARHAAGQALELPYRGTSYGRWAAALSGHARSETLARELAYWARLAGRVPRMLPRDIEGTDDTVASAGTVHVQLTAEETERLVREVPKAYRTHIQEVLVAALVRTVARWVGHAGVLLELEGHGREDVFEGIDLSRTVGWFTTIYPVYVQPPGHGIGDDLIAVKDQLRGVPGRGLGYGVLRYLEGESRQALARTPRAELGFNYLGQIDQVIRDGQWQAAGEPKGRGRSALQRRLHLIAVNGHISAGSLHLIWEYSTAAHHTQTIEHLAERCLHELRALIAHCCSTAGNYTPSDFPLARLDVDELAELMGDIEGSR
jgi:amino acid adenylation domain-containing protein/non-ribosomal peptide synthase protein (TIGR01720 family)